MENRSDYEKRLGEKLEAAYMLEDNGPGMSREEFHRLIMAAEKKNKKSTKSWKKKLGNWKDMCPKN